MEKFFGENFGSVDMKGGLASAMAAIKALRRPEVELPGDLWLLASMNEELEMTGVKAMIESGAINDVGRRDSLRAHELAH